MNIKVSYDEMRQAAQRMSQHALSYESSYIKFYEDIRGINQVWQGSDHDAYLNSIESFEDSFHKMRDLLNQISEFVQKASDSYNQAQEEIRQQAQMLHIG